MEAEEDCAGIEKKIKKREQCHQKETEKIEKRRLVKIIAK